MRPDVIFSHSVYYVRRKWILYGLRNSNEFIKGIKARLERQEKERVFPMKPFIPFILLPAPHFYGFPPFFCL